MTPDEAIDRLIRLAETDELNARDHVALRTHSGYQIKDATLWINEDLGIIATVVDDEDDSAWTVERTPVPPALRERIIAIRCFDAEGWHAYFDSSTSLGEDIAFEHTLANLRSIFHGNTVWESEDPCPCGCGTH